MKFKPVNDNRGNILVSLLKFLIFVIFFVLLFKFAQMYSIKMMNSFFNKEETKVPNLVSRDGNSVRIEDAFELCKQGRLQIDIKEKKFDNNIPEGCVMSQDPPPDTVVKVNRVIEVIISLGAKTVECPDVAGKDVRDVAFVIQNKGFLLGKKSYIPSESIPADIIISQTPEGNSQAPKGSQIDLLVSLGKNNQMTQVPNFVGKKIEAARIVLSKINLEPGKIGYETKEGAEPGIVLKQDPAPGTYVPDKSQVSFMVVEGPEQLQPAVENKEEKAPSGDTASVESTANNVIELKTKSENTETVDVKKPEKKPVAASATTASNEIGADGKRVEIVKFVVPPGQKSREIKIVLLDDMGPREIYKDLHYPGEEIDLTVTGYGAMKVLVYLDNVFFKDFEVGGR
ncbi:MAG TPA: PASTA domain-containing protein [Candidatus Wallbacteria bacterium]|nr:PASTA domain-containing protein [Candidatus Wallbacteria bacterium]